MAQLKDLIVNGASRFIGDIFGNKAQLTILEVPKTSGGTEYGPGTSGQVLKSNGSSLYWANDNNSGGTVTSVQVQATNPVVSSVNTAQTGTLNTTISLADGYGDTKNPYASKTKNYILAAPSATNGAPSFRALITDDIPTLSITDKTSGTLTVARGGTGKTTWDINKITYASAANTLGQLAHASSTSYLLTSGSASNAPGWIQYSAAASTDTIVQRSSSGNIQANTFTIYGNNHLWTLIDGGIWEDDPSDYWVIELGSPHKFYGNADTATAANIATTTTNALTYYTNTTGTFGDSAITITKASKHIAGFINGGQKSGTTLGTGATAEGSNTTASGNYSHAEGGTTTASGNYSHAEGYYTTAQRKSQHVFGEYSVLDTGGTDNTTRGNYIEIVGNGSNDNTRSNARTLDWNGNETIAGSLYASGSYFINGNSSYLRIGAVGLQAYAGTITSSTTSTLYLNYSGGNVQIGQSSTTKSPLSIYGETYYKSGHIYLEGTPTGGSTSNTTQLVFGTSASQKIVLSAIQGALVINPTTSSATGQIVLKPGGTSYISSGRLTINTSGNDTYNLYVNGTSYFSDNLTAKSLYVFGLNSTNSTRYITSTAANNIAFSISSNYVLVVTDTALQCGNAVKGTINLGASTHRWKNIYAKTIDVTGVYDATNDLSQPGVQITAVSGQWAYMRLHNSSAYWDIATKNAASGVAPANSLGFRYNGGDPSATAGVWITPAQVLMGAAWNDYAEYRETKEEIEPGRCVKEIGDDTLKITTKRLERGCEIVSDTYGFVIGKTENCQTPIASSGRVLAYGYEPREEFASHIGWPVCSGPNGTVSIMTEEEEEKYPSRIIGTISAVPDYEEWGTGNVKVNGRIWIRIR